jgi:hypothetical protein
VWAGFQTYLTRYLIDARGMSRAAAGGRAAHVASGVDPVSAKQRSDRTIAFYRGELSPDIAHPGTGS